MPDEFKTTEDAIEHAEPTQPVDPIVLDPVVPAQVPKDAAIATNTAVTSVLQWLTYSFWGWLVISIGYLVGLISSYTLNNSYSSISPVTIPSAVAAVVILLIIAAVTDYFYSKRETEHKTGIAMVLMVIHAVVFGILAVGSLIAIAFGAIQVLVGASTGLIGAQVAIITASTLFVVYVLILMRVVRPFIFSKFRLVFTAAFIVLAAALSVLAITGPVVQTAKTKNDRAVTTALVTIKSNVQQFVSAEKRLPANLDELLASNYSTSGQIIPIADLVKDNRITYTPNALVEQTIRTTRTTKTHSYQLCGIFDYAADKKSARSYSYSQVATRVDAGKYCQTLDATSYESLSSY